MAMPAGGILGVHAEADHGARPRGAEALLTARRCGDCGADISARHGLAKRCEGCAAKREAARRRARRNERREAAEPRRCGDCGADISARSPQARRCADCAGARQKARLAARSFGARATELRRRIAAGDVRAPAASRLVSPWLRSLGVPASLSDGGTLRYWGTSGAERYALAVAALAAAGVAFEGKPHDGGGNIVVGGETGAAAPKPETTDYAPENPKPETHYAAARRTLCGMDSAAAAIAPSGKAASCAACVRALDAALAATVPAARPSAAPESMRVDSPAAVPSPPARAAPKLKPAKAMPNWAALEDL